MTSSTSSSSFPLLGAWRPRDDLLPQKYQLASPSLPKEFLDRGQQIFERCATAGPDSLFRALSVWLSPSDVKSANVKLYSAWAHRPLLQTYKNAFVKAFQVDCAGSNGRINPRKVLEYFGWELTTPNNDAGRVKAEDSEEMLMTICQQHLPSSYPVTLNVFDPRRAVVWLCYPGESLDIAPTFVCVAGWTRWVALSEVLGGEAAVKKEFVAVEATEEIVVPIYMLNGTGLTPFEIHCLAAWLNYNDCGVANLNKLPLYGGGPVARMMSRPYGFGDFLGVVDLVIEHVFEGKASSKALTFEEVLMDTMSHTLELADLWNWVNGAKGRSPSVNAPGVPALSEAVIPPLDEQARFLVSFLGSFAYVYDYRRAGGITVEELKNAGVRRTSFWDRVLSELIPYQAHACVALADVCGLIRSIEPFFMLRSQRTIGFGQREHWSQREDSLVVHFLTRNEAANQFATRVRQSTKVKNMKSKGRLWPFDQLGTCACLYNYHYLLELEAGLYEAPLPEELPLTFNKGAERCLLMVRSILLNTMLTFGNPSYVLEVARGSSGYVHAPLEVDVCQYYKSRWPAEANFTEGPNRVPSPGGLDRSEQELDMLLGMLAELLFRCVCSGTGKAYLYDSPYYRVVGSRTKCVGSEPFSAPPSYVCASIYPQHYLGTMISGGSLLTQGFLSLVYDEDASSVLVSLPYKKEEDGSMTYHTASVSSMKGCRKRMYESVVLLETTGFDPNKFSHSRILFDVMMALYERTLLEGSASASEILESEGSSIGLAVMDVEDEILTKAISEVGVVWQDMNGGSPAAAGPPGHGIITPNPDAQTRITRWFEERKAQARDLVGYLFSAVKTRTGTVRIECDFRMKSPDEAKMMCSGLLSDLASESTNLSVSIQEIPYQFGVIDCGSLPFAQKGLNAVIEELNPSVRHNLEEGLQALAATSDPYEVVVVSARPAVICALWQTLTHLSPFFDVLHPLACQWHLLRGDFAVWLWSGVRDHIMEIWHQLCVAKYGDDESKHPLLRFSIRRLPGTLDKAFLRSIVDLTPARLLCLVKGPRILDRVASAFYRFQCSGMANAKAALGTTSSSKPSVKVQDLSALFVTQEPCLQPLFEGLWSTLDGNLPAEDALYDTEIAAAGFLKRYATFVLTGLDTQDKLTDAQGRRIDMRIPAAPSAVAEDSAASLAATRAQRKRASKPVKGEEDLRNGRRLEETSKSMLAGCNVLLELRRDLKLMQKHSEATTESEPASDATWLHRLPQHFQTLLQESPIPERPISSRLVKAFEERLELLRKSGMVGEDAERSNKRRRMNAVADETGEATPVLSGAFPELQGWLRDNPLWALWGSPLRVENGIALYTIPSSLDFEAVPMYRKPRQVMPAEWEVIRSVLDYLTTRGVTALYCSKTEEVLPLTTRGAFDMQADMMVAPAPVHAEGRRGGSMERLLNILEGDVLGFRPAARTAQDPLVGLIP